MNRSERRRNESSIKKNAQIINRLTPTQAVLMDKIAEEKAIEMSNKYISNFTQLLDRSMSAALIEFGIGYEEIDGIQGNMSKLLLEDNEKSYKLEKECINMTQTEMEVKAAIEGLLGVGDTKKQDIETLRDKFPKLSKSMLLNAYGKVKREMGLIENRIPREEVFAYLDEFADSTEVKITVIKLIEKFGFTENTAKTYYSKWKIAYMKDKTSTGPLLEKVPTTLKSELAKKIQCDKKLPENWGKVVQAPAINKVEDNNMKGLNIIEEKVVKIIKVNGLNGMYQAKTDEGVVLSREGMTISFKNEIELNEWVTEFKQVFALVV